MHRNVWEWCQDYWHDNYQNVPTDGSAWLSSVDNTKRMLRGDSFIDNQKDCRSANRNQHYSDVRFGNFGFRLVVAFA